MELKEVLKTYEILNLDHRNKKTLPRGFLFMQMLDISILL